jgi:hypothetical protein
MLKSPGTLTNSRLGPSAEHPCNRQLELDEQQIDEGHRFLESIGNEQRIDSDNANSRDG